MNRQRHLRRWSPRAILALVAAIAALHVPSSLAAAPPLRVALLPARGEPYVDSSRAGAAPGGIDWRLAQRVAEELRAQPSPMNLPLLRIRPAAAAGDFDLVCGLDRSRHPDATELSWSPPLAESTELLVGHRGVASVPEVSALPPRSTVGLVLGQRYGDLEQRLDAVGAVREDALSEARLLRKLILMRHPYAVLSLPVLRHGPNEGPGVTDGLASWRTVVARSTYHCAVPLRSPWPAAEVWRALERLKQTGRLTDLLQELQGGAWAVVVAQASPVQEVDRTEFRDYLQGVRQRLTGGHAPRLAIPAGAEQARFLREGLQLEPADVLARWSGQQFGGRTRAPAALDASAVRERLQQDPSWVGVLPLAQVAPGLRVVLIP